MVFHVGKRIRGGVLVGVVEALESHLSGICERQQPEKNVRPLTFMDSAFTGYTPCMDSRRTASGENGRPGRKLRPALCLQWRWSVAVAQGPKESFRTPLRDFYPSVFARVSARGEYFGQDTDNSLCFFTEKASVGNYERRKGEGSSREFMLLIYLRNFYQCLIDWNSIDWELYENFYNLYIIYVDR